MEKRFRIGEIADILGIAPSKLRYWEEQGLLSCAREQENHYRSYTASDFMKISDLVFYRSLGIPVQRIAQIENMELDEHRILCDEQIEALKKQREMIQRQLQRLQRYTQALEVIAYLQKEPFQHTQIDTNCIVPFDLIDADKLRQYMENPYLYSRVQDSNNLKKEQRGLTVPKDTAHLYTSLLWYDYGGKYVMGLMREKVQSGYPNDLDHLVSSVQKHYQTGMIISRFLVRARQDGILYDFYKSFIEIS